MFKIIKYVIFPITIALLLVIGIILSLNSNLVTSSIGVGILSSSIVSIVIWALQLIETINDKYKIKKTTYL